VYKELTAEIKAIKEKSNNDVFYEDNKIFKEEISEMQEKLDKIQATLDN
jgi:hypothetical protein